MSHKLFLSGHAQQSDSVKAPTGQDSSNILIILDSKVSVLPSLIAGIAADSHVAVLDETQDGVAQITALLQQHRHVAQVHLISHGAPGCLYLGNGELSLDTLEVQREELRGWFADADQAPSLLIYGCNVAAGDAGSEFLEKLHGLTGAAIAASKTRTGNADQGGDWNLEVTLGDPVVELAIAPEVQATYAGVFAPLDQADYDALRDLYQNTDGANWSNNTGWVDHDFSSNTPPDSSVVAGWFGITVTNDRVTQIVLGENQLTGGIPTSLGDLTNLEQLRLNNNQLSGPIPTELGQLIGLSRLDLTSNQLTGEIPASLGGLINLGLLQLAFNKLTGEIPTSLGNLTALTVLGLSDNDLTGNIPVELAQLDKVTTFRLTKNQLSGEVPQDITDFLTEKANESEGDTQITIDNPLSFTTEFTDQTVIKDSDTVNIPVSVSDIDRLDNAPASALSFTAASSDQNIATVAVVGDPGSQSIQITPVAEATGSVEITLVLTDGTDDGEQDGNAAFADFNRIEKFQFSIVDASEAPQITTNTLTIEEGATIPFTSDFLAAVDSNTGDETLTFTVSDVTGGQFELVSAPGNLITSFTQQQVKDRAIQFAHGGGELPPSYRVSVSDGVLAPTAPANVSDVTFTNVNDAPTFVLENGVSEISGSANTAQGIKVADIAVTDPDGGGTLEYSLTGVNADLFEVSNPTSETPALQIRSGASITPNTTYNVTVNLDDPQLGGPGLVEATQTFTLQVGDALPPVPDDFNGDRTSDILFRNTEKGAKTLVLSNGASEPTLANYGPFIKNANWQIQAVGNFNGDNVADIVWSNVATGQNVIWQGGSAQGENATVGSAQVLQSVTDKSWTIKGAGNFDDDDFSEILWYNESTDKLVAWSVNTDPAVNSVDAVELNVGDISALTLEATGDFDSDGDYDLLFSDAQGALSIQFMNGATASGGLQNVVDGGEGSLSKPAGTETIGTGSINLGQISQNFIAFRSADGSTNTAWFMNGATRTNEGTLPGDTALSQFDSAWQAIV